MEYTIRRLAKLAGISTRALRYYDEIGLLCPHRTASNGYRIYGKEEVDRLQQILFYRELEVALEDIKSILSAPDFDRRAALEHHLTALRSKQEQLCILIANVEKSIEAEKGDTVMEDQEKFEGFMQTLVEDNERQYGKEIREKYGEDIINRSNAKVKGMSREQYARVQALSAQLNETLKAAFEQGDPAGPLAQKACELHREWLGFYWPEYSKAAHMGVAQMYAEDPRFAAYYDQIAVGSGKFLRDAILIYCK